MTQQVQRVTALTQAFATASAKAEEAAQKSKVWSMIAAVIAGSLLLHIPSILQRVPRENMDTRPIVTNLSTLQVTLAKALQGLSAKG